MVIEPTGGMYLALAWTLAWKGVALWKAARKNHIYWFVAFLILNTLGILPIIYLLWMRGKEKRTRKNVTIIKRTTTPKTTKKKTVKKKTTRKKKR